MPLPRRPEFIDLRVTPEKPEVSYTLRLVGIPIGCFEHSDRVVVPAKPPAYVKVPFPNAALNPAPVRICTEDDVDWGPCPWCAFGYARRRLFAVNCLDQADGRLKILRSGITVFRHIGEWENDRELEGVPDPLLGGPDAPEVTILARYDAEVLGRVRYVVTVHSACSPVTEQEAEVIRAAGIPGPDEMEAIYKHNPELRVLPTWFICGFPLDKLFAPTLLVADGDAEG